jgi:tetratricopeptide (TPR) repeat protein
MAIFLLTVQSILLFARRKQATGAGTGQENQKHIQYASVLNFLLALAALFAFILFSSGALILSPEYGILIAQGTFAWIWTRATIIGVSVGMGLLLHATRRAQGCQANRLFWLVLCGLFVGVLTAFRLRLLNSQASSDIFRIRFIDMWNYVFLAWIVVVLSDWFLTKLKVTGRLQRISSAALLLTCCGLLVTQHARAQFIYSDPWTLPLWTITALLGAPMVMFLLTWISFSKRLRSRTLAIACSVLPTIAGFWAVLLWTGLTPAAWTPRVGVPVVWSSVVWTVWAVVLLLATIPRSYRSFREKKLDLPEIGGPGRTDDAVALIAFATMIYGIFDMCHSTRLDPVWDLTAVLLSWVVLTEIISGFPLWKARSGLVQEIRNSEAPVRTLVRKFGNLLSNVVAPVKQAVATRTASGVILTVVVVCAVLVAISEIPNVGKTIVLPFSSVGLSDPDKNLGQLVSDRVVNTIGLVGQEIRPDLLVASPREKQTSWVPASSDQAADVQAAVASNNLQIPGTSVSIPLGFLVTPIQKPMRWLLGVRVIRGSVQKDGDRYVLLASSSNGQTWSVTEPPDNSPPESKPSGDAVIGKLADTLAYKIISSDPTLTKLGMASSWDALTPFRDGLAEWAVFEKKQEYDALATALENFRTAVKYDPNFALAHYRLGQALLQDGQPQAAVDSFRDSLRENPSFVAGHIALAETLYYFDSYFYPPPAVFSEQVTSSDEEILARRREARRLLQRVIRELKSDASVSDRAAAYVGLCRDALQRSSARQAQPGEPMLRQQYVAFFYCKRAEYLYSRLPSSLRAEVGVKHNEVWLLDELGLILSSASGLNTTPSVNKDKPIWLCDPDPGYPPISDTSRSNTYMQAAQKYFQQALEKQPEDPYIQCSYASVSLALGDKEPMRRLNNSDSAHLALAERLEDKAKDTADDEKYRLALSEYKRTIDLSPSNVDALNDYAYVVWEWYLKSPDEVDRSERENAQRYAVKAARLTEERGSHAIHAMVQSTLGEVELARGQPRAAMQTLDEVLPSAGKNVSSESCSHAVFDEIRLDLALACVCASHNDPRSKEKLRQRANDLLKQIDDHESRRETRRFSTQLQIAELDRVCTQFEDDPATRKIGTRDANHH